MKKIAVQGIAGSFHDLAAKQFFGRDVTLCPCTRFDEIPAEVLEGRAAYGVMAIENTLAGAILPNYMLIDENGLHITGEIYIPVRHALMSLPGQSLDSLTEVYSHPMALLQCKGFLHRHPHLKRIEYDDTAGAARMIGEKRMQNAAAIAPEEAAQLYGLQILARNIQDHRTNTTRFVVLAARPPENMPPQGKVSFKVILKHRPGSLVDFLNVLKAHRMNMTKIQSVPLFGKPWYYAFFIDALYQSPGQWNAAHRDMQAASEELKILGLYPQGNKDPLS